MSECWLPLDKGKYTVVDLVDVDRVSGHIWFAHLAENGIYYARRAIRLRNGKKSTVGLHQILMGEPPANKEIDHRDGDGLNNRRKSNLRFVTRGQNRQNSRKQKNSSSLFKGVSWNKRSKKWISRLTSNQKSFCLGYFLIEVDAARAYDVKAKQLFGSFARLNFPNE